jgi:hypothetical protein
MKRILVRRDRERGSAMLVTLILISALLAGVAVLVSLQLTTSKSTALTRVGLQSLHCAESGLAASHGDVALNKTAVIAHLLANSYNGSVPAQWQVIPSFITTAHRDVDGDGATDVDIWIIDNEDANGYTLDSDSRVWLISRCTKYPDAPKEVRELIEFGGSPTQYDWQEGRAFGNNNSNAFN